MAINFLNRPVQEGDPIGSVYQPLTMNQLNKAYEEMSIYGDSYKNTVAPMAVDNASGINNNASGINNIDLTSSPINNILPYIPVTPQGDGRDNDDMFKSYYKYNDPQDPFFKTRENKTGLAGLIDLYKKLSPMSMIYRAGKTGIENIQKHFADKKENQKLADLAQQRTRQNEIDIIQNRLDNDPRGTGKGISSMLETQYSVHANENQANNAAARAAVQTAINAEAARTRESFRGNGGGRNQGSFNTGGGKEMMAKGGRIGYGTGGIVTL